MIKRNVLSLFSLVALCAISAVAQSGSPELLQSSQEANKIIDESRETVYRTAGIQKIKSLYLLTTGESYTRQTVSEESGKIPTFEHYENISNEYSIEYPDYLRRVITTNTKKNTFDTEVQIAATANKNVVDLKSKLSVNGQSVKLQDDISKFISSGYAKLKDISPMFSEKEAPVLSRSLLNKQASDFIFPLILTDIFDQSHQFLYIGKASVDGKTAFVLEAVPSDTQASQELKKVEKTRYFFDAATHFLIMITSDFQTDNFTSTSSIYFSAHKSFNGIMIPTRIKQESKTDLKFNQNIAKLKIRPSVTIKVTDIEVKDFEVNKVFPQATFEIKK